MLKKKFLAAFLGVATAGLMVGIARESLSTTQTVTLAVEVPQQATSERSFEDGEYVRDWTLGAGGEAELYGPLRAKVDHRDHIYVLDYGDFRIKELDPEGRLVRIYGDGRGEGPRELTNLSDIEIFANGEVWVSDPATGRVCVYGPDGELARTLKMEIPTYRLAKAPGGGFFSNLNLGSDQLFARFDDRGVEDRRFGTFVHDQAMNSIALDGWVESDGHEGLVFAGGLASMLAGFDSNGDQRFLIRTIDPFPLPKIRQDSEKRWIDRDVRRSATSLTVRGDQIHVFSYYHEGIKKRGTIDTYRLSDGSYLHSRLIPGKSNWVMVGEGSVVTTFESEVTRWRWIPKSESGVG